MVVGILRLTLYVPGASSLKDKRQVLRKVIDRLRSRFNVSVAEVADNDIWQRAVVGIAAVANDHSFVNEVLDKCARDAGNIAEILNREMEIQTISEMNIELPQKPEIDPNPPENEPSRGGAGFAGEGRGPQGGALEDEPEGYLTEEDFE
jgi:uncharacterized protein YlxP (DUF503 family)